jgi:hypothetical protein
MHAWHQAQREDEAQPKRLISAMEELGAACAMGGDEPCACVHSPA